MSPWNRKKRMLLVVCVCLFSFVLTGCSTFHRAVNWAKFWERKEPAYPIGQKEIDKFSSKIRVHKGNPEAHYVLACYYQQRGKHREAVKEFGKVLFIDPGHVRAYNGMGVSLDQLKDYQLALQSYERALKLAPDQDYIYNNLGYSHLLQSHYEAAVEAFRKAASLNDKSDRIHNNLGLAYAMKGEFEMAMAEFERAGDKGRAHYNLASVYYEKGMFEWAKREYAEALHLSPDLTGARKGLEASDSLARIARATAFYEKERAREERSTGRTDGVAEAASWSAGEAGIEVSNGNGVNNMARQISRYLADRGFNVVRVTNADSFNYAEGSIICRKGYCEMAYQIASCLPGIQNVTEINRFDRDSVKIKVLIGRDQLRYREVFAGRQG